MPELVLAPGMGAAGFRLDSHCSPRAIPVLSGHRVALKEHRMFAPISPLQLNFFVCFFSVSEYLGSSLPAFAGKERWEVQLFLLEICQGMLDPGTEGWEGATRFGRAGASERRN